MPKYSNRAPALGLCAGTEAEEGKTMSNSESMQYPVEPIDDASAALIETQPISLPDLPGQRQDSDEREAGIGKTGIGKNGTQI
jgi:hypothetical protein